MVTESYDAVTSVHATAVSQKSVLSLREIVAKHIRATFWYRLREQLTESFDKGQFARPVKICLVLHRGLFRNVIKS